MEGLDILAAFDATPRRGTRTCKLAQFLEQIPEGTPGLDALLQALDDNEGFPAPRLRQVFSNLGFPIGIDLVRNHRSKRCSCFLG